MKRFLLSRICIGNVPYEFNCGYRGRSAEKDRGVRAHLQGSSKARGFRGILQEAALLCVRRRRRCIQDLLGLRGSLPRCSMISSQNRVAIRFFHMNLVCRNGPNTATQLRSK